MKHLVHFIIIALLAATEGFSQEVQLQNIKAITDSIAKDLVKDKGPGLSIGVVYRGRPVLNSHYGLMNIDEDLKATSGTSYNLASVSKHITALGILLLEARGKLKLHDPIVKYLPSLPEEFKAVTIDQLLHHTSGIPSTDNLKLFAGISLDTPWGMEQELELLAKYSQLNFNPGTEYMYSNGGYSILTEVIEAAGGEDFADFFHREVFKPLGLQAETYNKPGKTIKNRAKGYIPSGETFVDALTEAESVPGGSNFYFNMDDMLVWMNLFLQENSVYSEQVSKMTEPSFILPTGDTLPYSYGLNVKNYKGLKAVYHSGGTPGFAAYMILFPEQDLGITILTNNEKIGISRILNQLTDSIFTEFLKEEIPVDRLAISLPVEKMKNRTGSYRMKDGMILKFSMDDEKLFLELPDNVRFQLHPESEASYFIKEFDARVTFAETGSGRPSQFNLIQGANVQTGNYIEPRELQTPSPALDDLVGTYIQPQLDVKYQFVINEGHLLMHLPDTFKKYLNFSSVTLKPLAGDVFNTDRLGVVEFLRNDKYEINGFRFNDVGRLWNINFVKIQ